MKLKKILLWGSGLLVAVAAGVFVAGYCHLYSWSWGSLPAAHQSITPEELQQLQKLDNYLISDGVEQYRSASWEKIMWCYCAGTSLPGENDQWETDPEKVFSWWQRGVFRVGMDNVIRRTLGGVRRQLHQLVESGRADETAVYLPISALHMHDAALVKLLITRGVNPNALYVADEDTVVPLLCEVINGSDMRQNYMPVEERLALLEWLLAHGLDLNDTPSEHLLPQIEISIWVSGDEKGQILEWMLRHGLQGDEQEMTGILLRYPTTLDTLRRLIDEGLLPPVPRELVGKTVAYTPLQMVANNMMPSPDTVRWLLSLGHDVNAVAATPVKCNADEPDAVSSEPLSPLDTCLKRFVWLNDVDSEERHLEVMALLLEHGATPSEETRNLLPHQEERKKRVLELLEQHGHRILSGSEPENPCCEP